MRAFCFASGLIEFGRNVPSGAIIVARGPAPELPAADTVRVLPL